MRTSAVLLPEDGVQAHAAALAQVVRVVGEEDAAVAHEDDRVDDRFDVGDEMGGDEHEGVGLEVAQDAVEDDLARRRVDARDGLVEQVDARPAAHDEGDLELLAHAPRHLLERAVDGQPEEAHRLAGPVGVEVGEEAGVELDGLPDPQRGVEEVRVAEVGDDRLRARSGHHARDGDLTGPVGEQAGQDLEEGGLAAAVGPHEADDAPRGQVEVEVVQRHDAAVSLGQAGDADQRRGAVGGRGDGLRPWCRVSAHGNRPGRGRRGVGRPRRPRRRASTR